MGKMWTFSNNEDETPVNETTKPFQGEYQSCSFIKITNNCV